MAKNKRPALKSKDLLPVLDVDLSNGPGEVILPCTETRQAKHLGWYVAEIRAANKNLKLYQNLPMVCAGSGCYWASQCETAPDFLWQGLRCPLETMEIYKHWVGYVKELEVGPSDYVDIQMVADLVRLEIQLTRIDQQLQIQGMMSDTVGGIIQNSGKDKGGVAVYEKTVHPLLMLQTKLRKDRNEAFKALEASRQAKRIARQAEGKREENFLSLMARVKKTTSNLPHVGDIIDVEPTSLPGETKSLAPGEVED